MNKLIILGNLTRDPQTRHLQSSTVTEFGIAHNRRYTTAGGEKKEEVCFLDCSAWGKTGEVIQEHFQKGKQILLEGRLRQETWEDKQGGGKRSKHTMTVDSFSFTGSRDREPGDDDEPRSHSHRGSAERTPKRELADRGLGYGGKPEQQPAERPFDEMTKEFEEQDIPFAWEGRSTAPA